MDGVGAASLDQSERVPGPLATSRPAPNARTCLPPEAGSQPGPIRRGAPGHNLGHQTNEDESRLCRGPGDNPGRARYRVLHYTGKPSRGQHCTAPVGSYGWHRRRPPVTLDGEVVAHHRQVSSSSTSTREMRSWISGSCFRSMGCNPLPVRRLTSSSQRCLRRFCRHPPPANGHRQRRTAAIPGATANASRKVTRRWPRTSVVYRAARSVLESLRRVKLPACTQCEPPARVPTTPYYRTIAWAATALAGSSPPQPPAGRSPCPPVSQPSTTSP